MADYLRPKKAKYPYNEELIEKDIPTHLKNTTKQSLRAYQDIQVAFKRAQKGVEDAVTDAATNAAAIIATVPPGAVMSFALTAAPAGWLECDGSSLLRTSYTTLFAAIGVVYGNVDGTHFNLPDYRGKFLRGWDHGAGNDPDAATRTDRGDGTSGDEVGSKQVDELKEHLHPVAVQNADKSGDPTGGLTGMGGSINTGNTGGNETRPINVYVLVCIKT